MFQKFRREIQAKYGEGCRFYPELTVQTETTQKVDGCDHIIGIIDLLVVDEKG